MNPAMPPAATAREASELLAAARAAAKAACELLRDARPEERSKLKGVFISASRAITWRCSFKFMGCFRKMDAANEWTQSS